jgi:hypothetical protein
MIGRRLVATALAFSLAGIPLHAQVPALGVVVQANRAHIGMTQLSVGTTIFQGDHLETEEQGSIRLQAGNVQFDLQGSSALVLATGDAGLDATLEGGTVVFSGYDMRGFALQAASVRVIPKSPDSTLGQMTLEHCNVLVASQRGTLMVTSGNETKLIEEGKAYRVVFDRSCSGKHPEPASPGGSRFEPMAFGAIGTAVVIVVLKGLQSPHRP